MWSPTFLFLNRLRRELPIWVDKGWVRPEHQTAILDQVKVDARDRMHAPVALAVLGVVLFGAGVISFFAANWDEMSKLVKFVVLLVALWGAYGSAFALLSRGSDGGGRFGHVLLLLGVILFGASIMLIAQAFHISGRFPNSILLWALGALVVTHLIANRMTAVFGLLLTALWTVLEAPERPIGFLGAHYVPFGGAIHWPFLVVWAAALPPIVKHRWRAAGHVATTALLLWGALSIIVLVDTSHAELIDGLRIYLLGGLGLYLTGSILARSKRLSLFSQTLTDQGMIVSLLCFYGLTLRATHGIGGAMGQFPLDPSDSGWVVATALAIAIVAGLSALQWWVSGPDRRAAQAVWGRLLLVPIFAVIALSLVVQGNQAYATPLYLAFNLLYLAGLVWLIFAGYRNNDRLQVNAGFLFFTVGLLTLYFDTFWGLMARSYFFMGLGVVLFAGGYLIERHRRRLIGELTPASKSGGAL